MVGERYRLRQRIGAGSFGEIYSAENIKSHRRVAVKLENVRSRVPQLAYESKLYARFAGGLGIPKVHWYGTEDSHNVLVMDLLGKSLENLLDDYDGKFSMKTVLMLADQMISCIEFVHSKGFVHRDIKPENFVMGLGNDVSRVFLIDYGLAKQYCDQITQEHIPYAEGRSLTGTERYASVAAVRGIEQSRRDDLESLGFVWLYLLRGSLPWQGKDRMKHKEDVSVNELCRGLPFEFSRYFKTVRGLEFAERPNYAGLRALMRSLFMRQGFVYDQVYDWCADKAQSSSKFISAPGPKTGRSAERLIDAVLANARARAEADKNRRAAQCKELCNDVNDEGSWFRARQAEQGQWNRKCEGRQDIDDNVISRAQSALLSARRARVKVGEATELPVAARASAKQSWLNKPDRGSTPAWIHEGHRIGMLRP